MKLEVRRQKYAGCVLARTKVSRRACSTPGATAGLPSSAWWAMPTLQESPCLRGERTKPAGATGCLPASAEAQKGTVPFLLRKNRDRPRGVSLLEVLIAMFVITIGMLGVAALIPTGHFAVVESTKADRAAACGRAAVSEVKIRRMLDSNSWRWPDPTPALNVLQGGDAFVIDPLFVASNQAILLPANWYRLTAFPYDQDYPPLNWGVYYLHRVTGVGMSRAVAHRIFNWSDALIFDVDRNDPEARTRASLSWFDSDSGNTGAASYPVRPTDPPPLPPDTAVPLLQAHRDDYSWMLTVSPAPTEMNTAGMADFRKFQVSVVVFFKRDLSYAPINPGSPPSAEEMPPERLTNVTLTGGGDVAIHVPDGHMGFNDFSQYEAYLNVRPNQWIMLMGLKLDGRVPAHFGAPPGCRRVAQWYRVVMVDDVEPGVINSNNVYQRRLTLAGPDWDPTSMLNNMTCAVLVDGVIGVYTKSVDSTQ